MQALMIPTVMSDVELTIQALQLPRTRLRKTNTSQTGHEQYYATYNHNHSEQDLQGHEDPEVHIKGMGV